MYIEATIETPIGTVKSSLTQGDHVYLEADEVTVNGVRLRGTLHLYCHDGEWRINNYNDCYLYRCDDIRKEPSRSAREKFVEVLAAAWTTHIAANPGDIKKAEAENLERRIASLVEEQRELLAQLQTKEKEINSLQRKRLDLLES